MEARPNCEKKQMLVFISIAFGLPFLSGILMGYGYSRGIDISVFPVAQMLYPAAGAILAALITRKADPLIPKRFFTAFLALTILMLLCSIASIVVNELPWSTMSNYLFILGSIALWIFLFTTKKDKRIAYGLKGGQWKASVLIILLYLVLYLVRTVIAYIVDGDTSTMLNLVRNPSTWIMFFMIPINFVLVFAPFFGEEYGWRYFLQPELQKRFGMVRGVLFLGVIWGFWHLPVNFFYYTNPSAGIISLTAQLITCISLGIFYGWAYLKTDNIWVVVALHFINNNLIPIITGNYSADVIQGQEITWENVLFSLAVNGLLFSGFILSRHFKNFGRRLLTMNERAHQCTETLSKETDGDICFL